MTTRATRLLVTLAAAGCVTQAAAEPITSWDQVFRPVRVVELQGTEDPAFALRDLVVLPAGGFAVTDFYEQGIRVYDAEGALIRGIPGGSDGNPHAQTTRLAADAAHLYATCLDTDRLTVLDFEGRRVGGFRPQGFTPNEIEVDGEGNVYLGGRCSNPELPMHGFAVHKFTPEFNYAGSWFKRHPRSETLAGPVIAFFGMELAGERLLAVQPLVYGVTVFDLGGAALDSCRWTPGSGRGSGYRAPYPYEGSASPRAQESWFNTWTQVLDVFAAPGRVYVVLQTHRPARYAVEVLDEDLLPVHAAVLTDHRLLDVDAAGRLYCLVQDAPDRIAVYEPRR